MGSNDVINSIINNKVSDYKQCSESHISKDIDICIVCDKRMVW